MSRHESFQLLTLLQNDTKEVIKLSVPSTPFQFLRVKKEFFAPGISSPLLQSIFVKALGVLLIRILNLFFSNLLVENL